MAVSRARALPPLAHALLHRATAPLFHSSLHLVRRQHLPALLLAPLAVLVTAALQIARLRRGSDLASARLCFACFPPARPPRVTH